MNMNYMGISNFTILDGTMKIKLLLTLAALSSMLIGCGGGMTRPVVTGDVSLKTESYTPSTWDLPLGSVVPEGSNLVLHRQPSKAVGLSVLFGPLGVVIANESLKSSTKEKVSALDSLRTLKAKIESDKLLAKLINDPTLGLNAALNSSAKNEHHFVLKPFILLEADRESSAQISVMLKLEEKNGKNEGWKGQYVRHLPEKLSLVALSNNDVSVDAEKIKQDTLDGLKLVLRVMLMDLNGKIDAAEKEVQFKQNNVIAWNFADKLKGRKVGYLDDKYLLIRTNFGSAIPFIYGTHILDKDQVTILSE